MQVFQSLGCSFFHFSPQDHVFSLWFPQFPVAFWLWAHHQEPWLRNRFEVISHPTLYYFSFFFLPTSFTSQGLLFPTRRNLKPKSMGKQQSKSSGAKSSGCFQALTQAPYAMTNYIRRLDLTAHGASHAWYFFLIMLIFFFPLKAAFSQTLNQFKSNPSLKTQVRSNFKEATPEHFSPQISQHIHTKQVLYLQSVP